MSLRKTASCAVVALALSVTTALPASAQAASTVFVHGTDAVSAERAVQQAGLKRITAFTKIGVVAARGSAQQIAAARAVPGVTQVEANHPIRFFGSTSHTATRGLAARQTLTGANGLPLDGSGVSVAVIDSGVDPTHPSFKRADGSTKIVRSLKSLCLDETSGTGCIVDVPTSVDTDLLSVGGHGTHVTGIAVGSDVTLTDGTVVHGAAPGAKAVVISTGAVLFIIGADAALNWVLENHRAPCGAAVPASVCPPIKAINNSYGPTGGGAFDPNSVTAKLQRALAAEGVVTVWANGNDGGDGSANLSNPPGQDPTPGVISVASYNDQDTGTRDGTVSGYSSRGLASDSATWPDISAPGENITSSCRLYLPICATGLKPQNGPGLLDVGTFNTISGTSMAAPHITGIVAQLFQANPDATAAQVEAALKSTAYKYTNGAPYSQVGAYTSSHDKGTGLVDVVAAAGSVAGP
jgi:serine protease AprX